jgi:hypothetical protein
MRLPIRKTASNFSNVAVSERCTLGMCLIGRIYYNIPDIIINFMKIPIPNCQFENAVITTDPLNMETYYFPHRDFV